MVRPDQESDYSDAKHGQRHRLVAKNALAGKAANDFADDAHAGQNHDVDGGVGVKPEQMLEQEWVSAQQRIENAQVEQTLEHYQHQGDRHDGRTQHLNDAGGVMGPDKQRQAVPGHSGGTHAVDGHDEVQSGEDRGKAREEDTDSGGDNVGFKELGAQGRVEGPTGVDAAIEDRVDHQKAADDEKVPAEQVDAREGQILGPDHEGDEEVAEHGGHGRDKEEEDHDLAVHGEQFVVSVGLDEVARRGQQLQADEQREEAANKEEEGNRDQVEQRDALVVHSQEPRLGPMTRIQVVLAFSGIRYYSGCHFLITCTFSCTLPALFQHS